MNIWKVLIALSLFAIPAILIWWQLDGGEIYTKTSVPVTVVDELFGTESTEWEDRFVLGLLPSGSDPREMTGVLTLALPFCLIIALALLQLYRAKRRSGSRPDN